jgi:hypothetical protein
MSPTNGSVDPLSQFHAPTIGDAVLEGATLLAAVRCPCQQHLIVQSQLVKGQWLSQQTFCPNCQTLYAIPGFGLDAQGALSLPIAKGPMAQPLYERQCDGRESRASSRIRDRDVH